MIWSRKSAMKMSPNINSYYKMQENSAKIILAGLFGSAKDQISIEGGGCFQKREISKTRKPII